MIYNIFYSFVLGLSFSLFVGLVLIPFLKNKNCEQRVSRFLNERHIAKDKTPTLGGMIFFIPVLISFIILFLLHKISFDIKIVICLFAFTFYFIVGFIDDFLKIKFHNNKGLSIRLKFLLEFIASFLIYLIYLVYIGDNIISIFGIDINVGFFYGVYMLFLFCASTNAVNITDGLDGLCGGLCFITFVAYFIIALLKKEFLLVYFITVICGSLIGYLYFNFYPAKIFMGDLGSLSLGALVASFSIVLDVEVLIVFLAFVFIIETISSFLQIFSIRKFHKKIFLKSPLHHHFEELGYKETEIIKLFYLVGIISSICALFFFFLFHV